MANRWCAWAVGPRGFGVYEIEFGSLGPNLTPSDHEPEEIFSPGLVDLHFHGAFGYDFMSASATELIDLAERLEAIGYEAVLLTTVTANREAIAGAIHGLPEHRTLAGVHLEGPFLSPKFPGAQPAEFLQPPPQGPSAWDPIFEHPTLKVVTLAPELEGALDLARRIARPGLTLSIGHTDATLAEADAAIAAGFRHVTHCFNAMRGFHHREPGVLGCAMIRPELTPELIYDRVHVAREAAQALIALKGADQVIAVSDSTMATGLPQGARLEMWGRPVVVESRDVRLATNGALAGSTITLQEAFRNLTEDIGIEAAIRMCTLNPRSTVGRTTPQVWLRWSLDRELIEVIRSGP